MFYRDVLKTRLCIFLEVLDILSTKHQFPNLLLNDTSDFHNIILENLINIDVI